MTSNISLMLIRNASNATNNSTPLSKVFKLAVYNTGTLTYDESQLYNTIFTWIKVLEIGSVEGGRRRDRQLKSWFDNIKDCAKLQMNELLTATLERQERRKMPVDVSTYSPKEHNGQGIDDDDHDDNNNNNNNNNNNLYYPEGHPLSLAGIILSIIIFARKSMRNSSTVFLIALNLAEAYSVTTLFLFQACNLDKDCPDNWFYCHFKLYSTTYLGLACQRSVYVYNCLVAVQRFLVVAFPVRFKTVPLFTKPLPLCICVLILSLTMHAYLPLRYAVVNRNGSHIVTDSQLASSHLSIFNALSSTSMYVLVYAPLLVGTTSSVAMCVAMRRHAHITRRLSTNQGESRRKEISTGILVSTFLFFTLSLPSSVNQLVALNTDHYGNLKKEHYLYITLSGAFVVVQVFRDLVIFLSFICASPTFRCHLFKIVTLAHWRRYVSKNETVCKSPVTQVSVIMESNVKNQPIKKETT